MKYTYPINLVGIDDGATTGEVVTRFGEHLGVWELVEDKEAETGVFHFIPEGENSPLFSETVSYFGSGTLTGLAMSKLCRSIDDWHNEREQA
jgi:hypothetical protein